MRTFGIAASGYGLEKIGLADCGTMYWNLPVPMLYEQAVTRREVAIAEGGPLLVRTGERTGRSPQDTFIVQEASSESDIWWGRFNQPISEDHFERLFSRVQQHVAGRDLFLCDCYCGADSRYRMCVRLVTERAWHSLFARNMFIRERDAEVLRRFVPEFTVVNVPSFRAQPQRDGTRSEAFIIVNLSRRVVLIGGTEYGGENKNGIFTAMNYFLPRRRLLSMHCSANRGATRDDVALFIGMSGSGKTTLSTDAERWLIGDDEHGWSEDGVFTFEGGCYATALGLAPISHPGIFEASQRFGTILENVVYDENDRRPLLESDAWTSNTCACYPSEHIRTTEPTGMAGHPRHIFFVTADPLGVLPAISRLTAAQAVYHFLSGYSGRMGGTEKGASEPSTSFSPCFAGPFIPLHPSVYAGLLAEKIARHRPKLWLLNTGWTGGPYGVGRRIELSHTRRLVRAALAGVFDDTEMIVDPSFGMEVPGKTEDVPSELLRPWIAWPDRAAYHMEAARLIQMFESNFTEFREGVGVNIREAAPRVRGV